MKNYNFYEQSSTIDNRQSTIDNRQSTIDNRQSTIDNQDKEVVEHFGREWYDFTNDTRPKYDLDKEFNQYFSIFPWDKIDQNAEGFDAGCGNGRWAWYVAPKVGKLNCIDPSSALEIAKRKLKNFPNVAFYNTTIDHVPLVDNSQDFGYCLGVLHHIPNIEQAMQICVNKLKPGASFLVYMYYNFENRPWWFRCIWKCSDLLRRCICRLPHFIKRCVTDSIALLVYWPLAKLAQILEKCNFNVKHIPLSVHRGGSFYNMRNCALDRFGHVLKSVFQKPISFK